MTPELSSFIKSSPITIYQIIKYVTFYLCNSLEKRGVAPTFTIENCERRSQNRQNKFEFYASYHFLTISFLLFKLASHSRILLKWMTRSECIFKNFQKQIVNAVHKFSAFCERHSQNCERRSQLWTWAPRSQKLRSEAKMFFVCAKRSEANIF